MNYQKDKKFFLEVRRHKKIPSWSSQLGKYIIRVHLHILFSLRDHHAPDKFTKIGENILSRKYFGCCSYIFSLALRHWSEIQSSHPALYPTTAKRVPNSVGDKGALELKKPFQMVR